MAINIVLDRALSSSANQSGLGGLLFLVGILTISARHGDSAARWAQAALILMRIFIFNVAVAPLVYVIGGERSSTRLRTQTINVARNTYILVALPVASISKYSMSPASLACGTYSGLFCSGTCLTLPLWAYYRLPETNGRTFRELDVLFGQKVPARHCESTIVDDADQVHMAA